MMELREEIDRLRSEIMAELDRRDEKHTARLKGLVVKLSELERMIIERGRADVTLIEEAVREMKASYNAIDNRMSHLAGVLNTHNDSYAVMNMRMRDLLAQYERVNGYLSTLEQIRAMLSIARDSSN